MNSRLPHALPLRRALSTWVPGTRAQIGGLDMPRIARFVRLLATLALLLFAWNAQAQSFRVQCPTTTPNPVVGRTAPNGVVIPGGQTKCQQISGGDGFATMADGTQTYLFAFGPLSGMADIAKGLPGTQLPSIFNIDNITRPESIYIGAPNPVPGGLSEYTFNGAVGLSGDQAVYKPSGGGAAATATIAVGGGALGNIINAITVTAPGSGYYNLAPPDVIISWDDPATAATTLVPHPTARAHAEVAGGVVSAVVVDNAGSGFTATNLPIISFSPTTGLCATDSAANPDCLTGHLDPRLVMDVGVLNGNVPAPLMAIDEDDEFFLTLTNVGQVMRPDLFEQHTVHFHGYANASAYFDGVPDASAAINIGGSFTYYYLAPDAGTYFWHCHITPPEHLQMGMVGQIYVRPRQNRLVAGVNLRAGLVAQQSNLRTKCDGSDILCSNPVPPAPLTAVTHAAGKKYAYNDGDGSTGYDVEYPLQMHGFDPNFHFVGMTFNPENFIDLKDKYFLLNGRSYPDTINPGPLKTQAADGVERTSQPMSALIKIPAGGKALLRISDLNVSEYHTLASLGIPMKVIAVNARLLRDQDGNNMSYDTNSITLAGGESLDVILDASKPEFANCTATAPCRFYLYTPQMDHLSNDAENFGGMMTEILVGSL